MVDIVAKVEHVQLGRLR